MEQITVGRRRRQKKLLLILPIMVLPFLTLGFWALGGGKAEPVEKLAEGLNTALPDAKLPDDAGMNKMAIYDKAEQGKYKELAFQDPNKKDSNGPNKSDSVFEQSPALPDAAVNIYRYPATTGNGYGNYPDHTTEDKIRSRLQMLEQQLKNSEAGNPERRNSSPYLEHSDNSYEVDKLNNMMPATIQAEKDPEIEQLQGMMKRIYDIQHPEVVKEELKKQSDQHRGIVYPVRVVQDDTPISLLLKESQNDSLSKLKKYSPNDFYGLENTTSDNSQGDAGIEAMIQENTTAVNGATIKMRLLQDVYINGSFIPKGNFINGTATLANDRLQIDIHSLRYNSSLYAIKLSVYDMDGMEGIYIPGSINRESVRQSGDNALQSLGIGTLDPSLSAQATAAGIKTAKSLLSKKIKLVRVFIKAGYRVLLKDNNRS